MLSKESMGLVALPKPKYLMIENQKEAYSMIDNANNILIHTDVDLDGFWSGYIMMKWLIAKNKKPKGILLNQGKKHGAVGISSKEVSGIDLLIILDSSCNELEQIVKDTGINVLVIDHHEIRKDRKLRVDNGENSKGVLINNMMNGDADYSAGLLVYEFIRAKSLYDEKLVENMLLYQNATFSLITDCIRMDNPRNLWYAEKTFRTDEIEATLDKLLKGINAFEKTMSKSVILYNIAPIFNKAIRAYKGSEALMYLYKKPEAIMEIYKYKDLQDYFIKKALENDFDTGKKYIVADIGSLGIPDTYCGVTASKLVEKYNRSCICLVKNKGSFRGYIQDKSCKYLDLIREAGYNIEADGHQGAFGITGTYVDISNAMEYVCDREPEASTSVAIALGNLSIQGWLCNAKSEEEWIQCKRQGHLVNLARANGLVSVNEQEYIAVPYRDIICTGKYEKYSKYRSWGMEFISMEPLEEAEYIKIYAEDNGREIKFFARK